MKLVRTFCVQLFLGREEEKEREGKGRGGGR